MSLRTPALTALVALSQPVCTTATSYDNTSHHEVTTGASKVLPVGNRAG